MTAVPSTGPGSNGETGAVERRPWQRWHRHRWSKWDNEPSTRIHNDVRHCEVCNKRQMRQP